MKYQSASKEVQKNIKMKTVILIGDGMGDYPCPELNDQTPLQAADMPYTRRIAAAGNIVSLQTVVDELEPGSDVANMGLLGYNPREQYTGRAPIEAAGAHIELGEHDVAFRCNLVTVENDVMQDHSSGHITTEEGHTLIKEIGVKLGGEKKVFHPGVSYRHILVWENGPESAVTTAPHDILEEPVKDYLPKGTGAEGVADLMQQSQALLANHPVNIQRKKDGKNEASQIWLWGQGRALTLQPYQERYGITGGIVTAVDLIKGLGILAGLETPEVEGATGFTDTNYAGKVEAGLKILAEHDFAYIHIEAPDECGHLGDAIQKTKACSDFDQLVVGPVWEAMEARGEPYQILVTMDHRTPCRLRKHSREPVPMAVLTGPVGLENATEEVLFDETCVDEMDCYSFDYIHDLLSQYKTKAT